MKYELQKFPDGGAPKLVLNVTREELEKRSGGYHVLTVVTDMQNGKESAVGISIKIKSNGRLAIVTHDFRDRVHNEDKERVLKTKPVVKPSPASL